MSKVLQHKVVAALPTPLEPDSIYYVRAGAGFDIHVTNGVGVVTAYSLNADLELEGKVDKTDARLTDSREWSEETVTQAEAEAGVSSARKAFTVQRVWQAINAWWQLVTSGFGRNFIAATNEQAARNVLQLTYPATAPTVGDGVEVLRAGAGGWMGEIGYDTVISGYPTSNIWARTQAYVLSVSDGEISSAAATMQFSAADSWGRLRIAHGAGQDKRAWIQGGYVPLSTGWTAELYHSLNTLNIGTTAATARTALNLFTDSSGIITNGSGALTNDVSEFLSLNTYADMSVKIQGIHSYVELPNNSSSSTPMAGYYYLLPRNNEYALTHTFTCTYSATTVKTWRMLVYRSWSTSFFVSPSFAVTGLSGSVKIYGTFQNAMTNVLIEFTQIGQNVLGQIVSQWD